MKRFLIQILIFSLLVIAVFGVGEVLVRRVENPYSLKANYLEKHAAEVSTLVLGHSETYYGIDASLMSDSAFNLAAVSQTLALDRALLAKYAPALSRLRRVIVPVSYTSLYDPPIEDTSEWWRANNYEIYYGLGRHSFLSRYSTEAAHIATYAGKLGAFFGLRRSKLRPDSLGHGTEFALASKYAEWRESGVNTARKHTESLSLSSVKSNLAQLDAMDSICRRLGAKLVLVTPPLWHGYRENINTALWTREILIVDRWCDRHGVMRLDYSDSTQFDDDDFYDADHLTSDRGAAKFTRMLDADLRKHGL